MCVFNTTGKFDVIRMSYLLFSNGQKKLGLPAVESMAFTAFVTTNISNPCSQQCEPEMSGISTVCLYKGA